MKTSKKKDLVEVIKANPDGIFTVDNDCWFFKSPPPKPKDEMTDADWDAYQDVPDLASYRDVTPLGAGGYGSGCSYGGDILQALAEIVGVKIESV